MVLLNDWYGALPFRRTLKKWIGSLPFDGEGPGGVISKLTTLLAERSRNCVNTRR
jgi:hypothetical protein